MTRFVALVCVLALAACPPSSNGNDGGKGGGRGGGTGGSGGGDAFTIYTLDPAAQEATYLAMTVDPAQERVGVVYYTPKGTTTNLGHPDYWLKYVEWKQGTAGTVETVGTQVQRRVGLSLQFQPTSGEPIAALLGGGQGFVPNQSIFWFQSDAALRTRTAGTWTEQLAATDGNQTSCGNPVSDRGFLVGLWPSIQYDSTGKLYFAYRDGHDGQFDKQDWDGSDVEVLEGGNGNWKRVCAQEGGNNKQAWGGHIQLAMGPSDQPAMIYDMMHLGADTVGANVVFQTRAATGAWSPPNIVLNVTNTQSGAALAYDATEGYGIAVYDVALGQLEYTNSTDGKIWSSADPAVGAGSSGWYPSLAMDPTYHEPVIAYYHCSPRAGATADQCLESEDELRVTQRVAGTWRDTVVDPAGGYSPKLAFFASGKKVVAYRDPRSGVVKLAVEK